MVQSTKKNAAEEMAKKGSMPNKEDASKSSSSKATPSKKGTPSSSKKSR